MTPEIRQQVKSAIRDGRLDELAPLVKRHIEMYCDAHYDAAFDDWNNAMAGIMDELMNELDEPNSLAPGDFRIRKRSKNPTMH